MSMFKLKEAIGTNYRVDPNDLMNTKRALNQLGYYDVPPHRGIDDWTDDATFDGIRNFQRAKGLKVDGLMRPGGPTERAINEGLGEGERPNPGWPPGYWPDPGDRPMVKTPPQSGSNMPIIKKIPYNKPAAPYRDKDGVIILEGIDPRTGFPIPPPKGPY